jgi:biotin synthase
MSRVPENPILRSPSSVSKWHDLAGRVLDGHRLTAVEGLAILESGDEELLDLLAATYRVRHRWFGNEVHLNYLINAKCGGCGEDCGYCSQSRVSQAPIARYPLIGPEQVLDGARVAAERQARTYCIVTSGREPGAREVDMLTDVVPRVKAQYRLKICASPGLLTAEQAARLKAAGVDRVNHNLNTGRRFYPRICTTHAYQDRLDTLSAVRRAGMEICSGGIIGMGEQPSDVVDLAMELGVLEAEAVPVNFFQPIAGTPLGDAARESRPTEEQPIVTSAMSGARLSPRYCLKVLCLFRFANPRCELRIAAGREMHLGWLQPLGLYPANSIFVGDYLTTKGQAPEDDYRMIEAMGFQVVEA